MTAIVVLLVVASGLLCGALLGTVVLAAGLSILASSYDANFSVVGNAIWNTFFSYTFTAIPVFILLGELMAQAGLAQRLYTHVTPLFRRVPGQLLQVNIASSALFSAISGSSTATTAMVASVAMPELRRRGYSRRLSLGSIAAGGTLGILIPPSIALIVYGAWQGVSISGLFIGAIVPGLLLCVLFMIYLGVASRRHGATREDASSSESQAGLGTISALAALGSFLLILFAVLGTVFLGIATPTEAAALGVAAMLVVGLVSRTLNPRNILDALSHAVQLFGMLALVIVGAVVLAQALALIALPQDIVTFVTSSSVGPALMIGLIYLLYVFLGCFFGPIEMLLITLPIIYPLVVGMGFDPLWFGIALVIVIEIGLLSPPLGINLFIIMAMSEDQLTLWQAARCCIPFILIMLGTLVLITMFPQIVLWLPRSTGLG